MSRFIYFTYLSSILLFIFYNIHSYFQFIILVKCIQVADVARAVNIPCEAELGKVGGKEDDLVAVADTNTELMKEKPDTFDPKALGKVGMAAVKELVKNRMAVCGCPGKADDIA